MSKVNTMEIGSIFEIDPINIIKNKNKTIPMLPIQKKSTYFAYYFNTGRTAIEVLLKKLRNKGFSKVLIPSFLCDSVREAALRAGMELKYYRVNADLSLDTRTINMEEDCILYIVQFFGQRITPEVQSLIKQYQQKGYPVVEDISLSLLSDDDKYVGFGDYIIGSLRKWLPIVDGGILLTKEYYNYRLADAANDYTLYYFTAQLLKEIYLKEEVQDKEWKNTFLSYNNDGMKALFNDYTLRKMSRISLDLMRGIDFEAIRERRIMNYDLLNSLLYSIPQIKVLVDRKGMMTPLGMIVLCEQRDDLVKHLIARDIYCNVHWRSNESTKQFQESAFLADRCITIPCDQRYGEKEMHYIFQSIADYYGV